MESDPKIPLCFGGSDGELCCFVLITTFAIQNIYLMMRIKPCPPPPKMPTSVTHNPFPRTLEKDYVRMGRTASREMQIPARVMHCHFVAK